MGQAEIPSQRGKTVVVTGATGGLGYETALALAKAGADVILTGRDDRKGQSAIEKISRDVSGARIIFESLDLANLASVSNAAHPGFARTNLFAGGPGGLVSLATDFAAPFFGHSAADGARPILFAATSGEARPRAYYGPGGLGELRGAPARALIMPQARDAATAAKLWEVSEKLTGASFS